MRKWFMTLAAGLLVLTACDKMTTDLEGKWLLKQIESKGTSTPVDTVWYNFQTSLFMYQLYDTTTGKYDQAYGLNYFEGENEVKLELPEGAAILPKTDWDSHIRVFKIEKVSRKELVLSSEGKTYFFDKF